MQMCRPGHRVCSPGLQAPEGRCQISSLVLRLPRDLITQGTAECAALELPNACDFLNNLGALAAKGSITRGAPKKELY